MNLVQKFNSVIVKVGYAFSKGEYRLEKPIVVQFPVIDICNSRCQMCKIWENKKSNDISAEQLRVGLESALFSEVAAVGINGGEPTLRSDLPELTQILFEKLPKLKTISLITNGYKNKDIIEAIKAIGEVVDKNKGHFDVMVSLDGYGDVHDRVRGRDGNFERAVKVLNYAKSSPLVSNIRVGCTVIRENVYHLMPLLDFCEKEGVYVKYRLGIPHQRLYTADVREPYNLTLEERYEFVEFLNGLKDHYEINESQKFFYQSLIGQLVLDAPRAAGCDWKHRGATITSKGELLYCAVQSDVLSKEIWSEDVEKAYFGNQPHLSGIIENKCKSCNHDYVGLPAPPNLRKIYLTKLVNKLKFKEILTRVGLTEPVRKQLERFRYSGRKKYYSNVMKREEVVELGSKEYKVLICGWYGTETLGDKAILGGVVQALRSVYKVNLEITIVSLFQYVTEITKLQMSELKGVDIISVEEALINIANYKHLVFGGGPLMNIFNIAEMAELFNRAKESGLETSIAGCGVGPIGKKYIDSDIASILKRSDSVVYRDLKSFENANFLGVDTSRHLISDDPAFSWLKSRPTLIPFNSSDKKVLLLGLREFPYHEYAADISSKNGKILADKFEQDLRDAFIEICVKYPSMVIRPLPMCTNHFGSDDRWFYKRLFSSVNAESINLDLSLLGKEEAPDFYVQAFRQADYGLMMRFHSVVFALSADLPCAVIDYTRGMGKVSGLCENYKLENLNIEFSDSSAIVAMLDRVIDNPIACDYSVQPSFLESFSRLIDHSELYEPRD